MGKEPIFKWTFHRLGGLDQVVLHTDEDFRRLGSLDPKLWVALSCPSSGLEFDDRTLNLLDTDKDGRIRIPEIITAVNWVCACLAQPSQITQMSDRLPLSSIHTETEEGIRIAAACRSILDNLGKTDAEEISPEDVAKALATAAENLFNGDGIMPPSSNLTPEISQFIQDALDVVGGVTDASGKPGINEEIAKAFIKILRDWLAWKQTLDDTASPLGENTSEAWEHYQAIHEKIDDYFLRCELAAYAPQTLTALNVDEKLAVPTEHGLLENGPLSELPLSRIEADRPLNLSSGLNPAWAEAIGAFFTLAESLLSEPGILTKENWLSIQKDFLPYAKALALKPEMEAIPVDFPPTSSPEALGVERIKQILESSLAEDFKAILEKDSVVPTPSKDIADVEKLVLYNRHLYRLLINFVSFSDFYALQGGAAFQAGTLYIDGRSCRLCLRVKDAAKHSALAIFSQLYLIYCECHRTPRPGETKPAESMTIVAAVTAGDSDLLLENRNGVFIDNEGHDWDATVVKIISNPIGIRQALLSPYKRFGRMITEQINKFATNKDNSLMATAGQKLGGLDTSAGGTKDAAAKFDIGKSVGIFAAVGLALGALGTAVASILRALFSLQWWQFPLLLIVLFLIVSGPSVVMAWLKLRKRTLGPLLEASGWAVNGWVSINFLLGRALTSTAILPNNATRSFSDPLKKKRHWPMVVFLIALTAAIAGAGFGWYWYQSKSDPAKAGNPPAASVEKTPAASPEKKSE